MRLTVGEGVASILRRSITSDTRTIAWEEIVDEGFELLKVIDSFDWSNDPVSHARCRMDLRDVDHCTETVTFRRNTGAFGFVGEGGALPRVPINLTKRCSG
jgi:hypothetical protein